MQRRFLFLINPIAGTRSKEGLMNFLAEKAKEAEIPFEFYKSAITTTPETLLEEIRKFDATDLIACGGDGTVNLAAKTVLHTDINLGIIAVGSGNGLARTAGISMKPGIAFRTILKGKTEKTDAFTVNGHFSCMLTGIGLDAAVALAFSKSRKRGLFNYTKQSIKEFIKASPFEFTLTNGSLKIDSQAYFISIANSNQFGNNFTIAPKASLHDGLLDVVIVKKMWKVKMLYAISKQLSCGYSLHQDKNPESEEIIYLQTPALTIFNPSLSPLHIDGDPASTDKILNIKVIPGAFNLLVP